MDDRVDAVEGTPDGIVVADVAGHQLDLGVEVVGPLPLRMHLGVEVVERADGVALGQQPICEMGADEPGAARDQDVHSSGEATERGRPGRVRPGWV